MASRKKKMILHIVLCAIFFFLLIVCIIISFIYVIGGDRKAFIVGIIAVICDGYSVIWQLECIRDIYFSVEDMQSNKAKKEI